MTTFFKISAKCTNFEVSVSNFKSRVSEFLMKSRSRSFNQVSKVTVSTTSLASVAALTGRCAYPNMTFRHVTINNGKINPTKTKFP